MNNIKAKHISSQEDQIAQLKQEIKDLKQSNQDLEHFAYVASHDLQAPLRTVEGYLQIIYKKINQETTSTDTKEHFEHVFDGVHRLKQLIDDLLEYSRAGRMVERQLIKSRPMLEIVKYNFRYELEGKDIEIITENLPAEFVGHRMGITQLFQNLLSNSINFSKKDQPNKITISAEDEGSEWHFCFHDEGIGIEEKDFIRIFELFTRLHPRGKGDKGTGIGLALCKRIVESHGGKIWLESILGEGTCVHFTIEKTE